MSLLLKIKVDKVLHMIWKFEICKKYFKKSKRYCN